MVVAETGRLRLRRLTLDDAPFILELLNEPSWLRFIGDKGVHSLEDARGYLTRGPLDMYARHGFGLYLVELHDGTPAGMCGVLKRDGLDHPDLGFAFVPRFWGAGYAREAAAATMAYARESLGLGRILAITSPDNERSGSLLLKIGFTDEGLVRLAPAAPEVRLYAAGAP